jgi:hypothetical protein
VGGRASTGRWLASLVYHSRQSKIGSRAAGSLTCGWCVGSKPVPVAVEEGEAVGGRASRLTALRQSGVAWADPRQMMFQSGAGQIQNFDHRDMNNHAEIGNSVTHLAAPRKTYAPPRRPGTGKTYSETGRHAWGERTRPPKFIGKNRTYTRRCGVAMWLSKPAGGWRACGGTRGKAAPRCR